jgi:hypothetical protein
MGQHWLAVVFVLLALLSGGVLFMLVTGRLQLASEWPGLVTAAVLLSLMIFGLRR